MVAFLCTALWLSRRPGKEGRTAQHSSSPALQFIHSPPRLPPLCKQSYQAARPGISSQGSPKGPVNKVACTAGGPGHVDIHKPEKAL